MEHVKYAEYYRDNAFESRILLGTSNAICGLHIVMTEGLYSMKQVYFKLQTRYLTRRGRSQAVLDYQVPTASSKPTERVDSGLPMDGVWC